MSSEKKQDEETGAEEPRSDETLGEPEGGRRPDDDPTPDGIEDAEVLGETVADGSRFDHDPDDEPEENAAEAGGFGSEDTTPDDARPNDARAHDWTDESPSEPGDPDHAPWSDADVATAEPDDSKGDEPDADRPYAPADAEPMSAASAVPDAAPDPAPSVAPAIAPDAAPAAKSGGGFMPALLGGAVAAALGFAASEFDLLNLGGPDPVAQGLSAQSDRLGDLEQQIASLTESLQSADTGSMDQVSARLGELTEGLGSQLNEVASSVGSVREELGGAISGLASRLDTVSGTLGEVDTRLGGVTERLTAVERRPLQESSEAAQAAFDAYERDIAALREQVSGLEARNADLSAQMEETAAAAENQAEAAEARAAQLQAEAETEAQEVAQQAESLARAAATREALASLDAAIEKGAPFEATLAKLSEYVEIPAPLSEAAGSGIATLAALRESFDPAAREALDDSIRATVGDDPASRVTAFLRAQTGIRSLSPREGDDPDAVLSRADAAVEDGDLATALTELEALPEPGQAAMADWVAKAETKLAVTQAAASLTDTLLAN